MVLSFFVAEAALNRWAFKFLECRSDPPITLSADPHGFTYPGRARGNIARANRRRRQPTGSSGVRRARMDADEAARTRNGPGATAGLEGLRFHDLRGGPASRRCRHHPGLGVGSGEGDRARHITGEAIGLGMIARLAQGRNRRATVKPTPRGGGRRRSKPTRADGWGTRTRT